MAPGAPIEHTFTFRDVHAARRFVTRLCLNLRDLAIYIDGPRVRVWGEGAAAQHEEIVRLSRESGAIGVPPAPTRPD